MPPRPGHHAGGWWHLQGPLKDTLPFAVRVPVDRSGLLSCGRCCGSAFQSPTHTCEAKQVRTPPRP